MFGGGMMGGWGGSAGLGLIGMVLNVAIVIGVIVLIVWVVNRFTSNSVGRGSSGGQSPREVLQTRYASGEITRGQYQQMLKDLS